ncbi:hypothetical protein B9086_012110 [Morganella morganii subsp. morganii]|uniref:hypothetical protein n=1 Tax=Morganella morganii TaxID=582 RepID=UPI000B41CF53|nr:hypothetical protein [Morganella morganii]RNW11254.1 hypothetical protein B9086_012110 [Morganella morganii subsp. morganii]
MKKDSSINVWQANGIPRLEFCSAERAAKLLNCDITDIHQWIDLDVIQKCIALPKIMSGKLSLCTDDDIDITSLDGQGFLCLSFGTGISQFWCGADDEIEKEKALGGYWHEVDVQISGVWEARQLRIDGKSIIGGASEDTFRKNVFIPVEFNENVKFISVVTDDILEFTPDDYLIIADDIEKLYNAGCNGSRLFDPEAIGNYKNEDIPQQQEQEFKLTIHQVDMIQGLMRLIGFSDDEITKGSASDLNSRLSEMAARKRVTCRTPDPKTWEKWRKKMK